MPWRHSMGMALLWGLGCAPPAQPLPDPPNSITPVRAAVAPSAGVPLQRCAEAAVAEAVSPLQEVEPTGCIAEAPALRAED